MDNCSEILNFYKGIPNKNGISIYDCINASDEWLEMTHNYIQWCFPNRVPSKVCPDVEVLTDDILKGLTEDGECLTNIRKMTDRMIEFYKNNPVESSLNHNSLRITRILLFLREADDKSFVAFNKLVEEFIKARKKYSFDFLNLFGLNDETIEYWNKARNKN